MDLTESCQINVIHSSVIHLTSDFLMQRFRDPIGIIEPDPVLDCLGLFGLTRDSCHELSRSQSCNKHRQGMKSWTILDGPWSFST